MELPPRPQLKEFVFGLNVYHDLFKTALAAWERVCKMIIEANKEKP